MTKKMKILIIIICKQINIKKILTNNKFSNNLKKIVSNQITNFYYKKKSNKKYKTLNNLPKLSKQLNKILFLTNTNNL